MSDVMLAADEAERAEEELGVEIPIESLPEPEPAPETGYAIPDPPDVPSAEDEGVPTDFAFLVFVRPDGKCVATSDDIVIQAAQLRPSRQASLDDMRRATHEITDDINATITANTVVAMQMQLARQAQQQAQAQKLLDGTVDLSQFKGRRP